MSALGRELVRRGHRVTVFGVLDAEAKVAAAGLEFQPIGERAFPRGSRARFAEELGKLSGRAGLKLTLHEGFGRARMMFAELPEAMSRAGVTGLFADQIYHVGRSVAERLGIPVVTVCNALPFNGEAAVPPPVFHLAYRDVWWARCRNWLMWAALKRFMQPLIKVINQQRANWNLPPHASFLDAESPSLVISQQASDFEFPRPHLPPQYRFVGPMIDPTARASVEFPFERLSGKPLIYASLGTLQTRLRHVYQHIADACGTLDVQLVLACGGATTDLEATLPKNCLAVPFAPQLEIIPRAALVVTHAGLNTALESLTYGVPMVAIPITNDQPGVAARIEWTGTGTTVSLRGLTPQRLRAAIVRTLGDPAFRTHAERLRQSIARTGGARQAAELAERVMQSGSLRL